MKAAFYTLGCKLNYSETSTIGSQFQEKGFEIIDYDSKADVYVINTCTVTENAEKDCRQIVRRALKNNPEAYIIVTGCYAQLRPNEIAEIDGVDLVVGSNEKFDLFSFIESFEKNKLSCIHVSPTEELDSFNLSYSTDSDSRTRAFLKIQDGCDYKCSFCTIPLARGKSRSAKPELILDQFKKLLDSGYKEIILTGVNVGDYGKSAQSNFYSLLNSIVQINGEFRVRISSIEPNLLTDEIIDLAAGDSRLCNHFHIPLQSGSDKILKLMQRRYKVSDYENLIYKVNEKINYAGIGVDVIVGSPGETEADFLDTYNFLNKLPISYLHVFTYSERPNTKALEIEGKVDVVERKRRNNMLRILSEKKRNYFYNSLINKELDVLFEHENHDGWMRGFTSNYVRVKHPYNPDLINSFTKIKIKGIDDNICTAELLNMNSLQIKSAG